MSYIKDAVQKFIECSNDRPKAVTGFDGFIDVIAKPVKQKLDSGNEYFETIDEFGEFIKSRAGKSCLIKYDTQIEKLGGNAPIFSLALAKLNSNVELIGALGSPEPNKLFAEMPGVNIHSITEPGITTALEFKDGKIMLSDSRALGEVSYETMKNVVGVDKLAEIYSGAGIIGMFNWNDIKNCSILWKNLAEEFLPNAKIAPNAILSVDLCDVASRSAQDICEMIDVLRSFKKYCKVVLNVNFNEYSQVYAALTGKTAPENVEESDLIAVTGLDVVCVHLHKGSTAFDASGSATVNTYFIKNPKISTGGGDNFNAGFTMAVYRGLSLRDCLVVANAVSGFYIKNGHSPEPSDLLAHAEEWEQNV